MVAVEYWFKVIVIGAIIISMLYLGLWPKLAYHIAKIFDRPVHVTTLTLRAYYLHTKVGSAPSFTTDLAPEYIPTATHKYRGWHTIKMKYSVFSVLKQLEDNSRKFRKQVMDFIEGHTKEIENGEIDGDLFKTAISVFGDVE